MHHPILTPPLSPTSLHLVQVHPKHAGVQTSASCLLRSLASTGGVMRANIVAAGALPAVCSVRRAARFGRGK